MLTKVLLLAALSHLSYSLGPCPSWGDWKESNTCVMPTDLESTVSNQCPQTETSSADGRRKSRGNFFKTGVRCMPWNEDDVTFQSNQVETGFDNDNNSTSSLLPSGSDKGIWEKIYTTCGSCGLKIRCRTRKAAFACSPSIEVDRAPCAEANMKPACQLGPQECSVIGNQLSQKTLRNIKRNMKSRSSSVKTGKQNGSRRLKSAQWTKVRSFEELVKGKSVKRSSHAKQGGFRKMEETPLPDFNCAKSGKGCVCCCQPFVPIDGICQDPDASLSSGGGDQQLTINNSAIPGSEVAQGNDNETETQATMSDADEIVGNELTVEDQERKKKRSKNNRRRSNRN